jgi:MscS family membrane protein
VSKTINAARDRLVDAAGGEESVFGVVVGGVLSVFTGELLGRPIWLHLLSLAIVLGVLFLRHVIARRFGQALKGLVVRTKTPLDEGLVDLLLPCVRLAVALLGIYIAVQVFFAGEPLPVVPVTTIDRCRVFFRTVMYLLLLGNVAWALIRIADVGVHGLAKLASARGYTLDETFVPIARRTVKVFVVAIAGLQALDYLEFNAVVASLVAAAGVSGLALGLAAQDTLKNFFGSIVLLLDRPFSVGDWIAAGGTEGIVQTVGLRSTKICTFEKTIVTVPNSSIVDRDINNMTRRPVRRVNTTIGVTYSTKPNQMEELLHRIRSLLQSDPGVWQESIVVRFTDFGDSSLNILLTYFTRPTAWDEHLEIRERINFSIMRILEELGLEIAFPTRTVHLLSASESHEPPPPSSTSTAL